MKILIKTGNITLFNFLEDFKLSIIEADIETPSIGKKDSFESPSVNNKVFVYKLKLKGYDPTNNIVIFQSKDKEAVEKFQENLFKQVSTIINNPEIYTDRTFFINLDKEVSI